MSALSAVLLIFSFQFRSAFLPCRQPGRTAALVYPISDVAENLAKFFCTEHTAQRNDFELILTVTMETRYPIEGSFGSEFRAICNHCVVMAA